jgi:tRNA A37 N6-isopentenylltransferase MiaA
LYREVNIGSAKPEPVIPVPNPVVPVVIPEGRFGLGQKVYVAVIQTVPANENRKAAAQELAKSYRGISSAIAAGTLSDPSDILTKTTESNRSKLETAKIDKAVWAAFFGRLQDEVYELYGDKAKLVNKTDFKDAWAEIAAGLEAIQ